MMSDENQISLYDEHHDFLARESDQWSDLSEKLEHTESSDDDDDVSSCSEYGLDDFQCKSQERFSSVYDDYSC